MKKGLNMKINRESLLKITRDIINKNRPSSRKRCPTPEILLSFYQGKLSKRKAKKIIDHLLSCPGCLEELELIRSIKGSEDFLIKEISKLTENKKESHSSLLKKIWLLKPFPAMIGMSLALLLVIVVLINPFKTKTYRGYEEFITNLPHPEYNISPLPTLIFKWPEVEKAQSYYFELFDETLYPIWRTGPLTTNRLTLPSEILSKIESKKRYFWVVTALLPDGTRVESPLTPFELNKH